jgi:GGDEF domain-containing protein
MRLLTSAGPDQYHAFTTRLTAAGYQALTMRVVAGCIMALALPSILAGLAPSVTPWPGFRIVYTLIAVACLGLAVPWLRYRWPTRRESAVVVVLGTVALATGCLATVDPLAGMVTASAFSFILGYTALFHSARILGFTIVVAAGTVAVTIVRIAVDEVNTAIAVATPVLLLYVVVTFACRTVARVSIAGEVQYDIDSLTGLLMREAFYERASTLIGARHRDEDRYLVVAVVDIDGFAAITSVQGGRGTNDAQVAVSQALRETARREAALAHVGSGEFLIADVFTISDPAPLIERVRGAIAATPAGITVSIGVVSTPLQPLVNRPPHDVLDELIALGSAAMADARRRGGNQSRYLLDPQLESGESTE